MTYPTTAQLWSQVLPRIHETPHFAFYGLWRYANPSPLAENVEHGPHGLDPLAQDSLLQIYAKALEDAYDHLIMFRPTPILNDEGRIPVLLFAVDEPGQASPYPHVDQIAWEGWGGKLRRIPTICLSTRLKPVEVEHMHRLAEVVAIHELMHVFNMRQLPLMDESVPGANSWGDLPRLWQWLDEGLALWAESQIRPKTKEWLSFVRDWVDRPAISLVDEHAKYQAVMFVRYLERFLQTHNTPIFSIWDQSATIPQSHQDHNVRAQIATVATEDCLKDLGYTFISHDPDTQDVFAYHYCVDSWFISMPGHVGSEPEVFARFGHRAAAITTTLVPSKPTKTSIAFALPPLSCLYFKYHFPPANGTLAISVDAPKEAKIKVILAAATLEGGQATDLQAIREVNSRVVCRLDPANAPEDSNQVTYIGTYSTSADSDMDHIVVTLANCDLEHSIVSICKLWAEFNT